MSAQLGLCEKVRYGQWQVEKWYKKGLSKGNLHTQRIGMLYSLYAIFSSAVA